MGRMFRIITEGPIEAVSAGAALAHTSEPEAFVNGGAPYIEVGGPTAVFHGPKATHRPIEQTPPPVKSPEYLSVAMQAQSPKAVPATASVSPDIVAFHAPNHAVAAEYLTLTADM